MNPSQFKRAYIEFFMGKGHKEVPSASLIPTNDPTVLFTTAGMHPLVPYLLGQKHPLGKRIVNVQKCIRTQDIEGVGDACHHTFFEMLGNWSLGDYFKREAITFSFEFLTKTLELPLSRLAVSVFAGDDDAPRDEEAAKIWVELGMPKERIAYLPKENNWWGPAGETGPCGPDTEMFYWVGKEPAPKHHDPTDKRWVEIWNDVFMQYNKTKEGNYVELSQKNVDTGMGVERTLAVLNGLDDNYKTELFLPLIRTIEKLSGKAYTGNERSMRIIADHLRAATFILGDARGIKPSNVGQGYVLRRLIRRAIRYGRMLGIQDYFTAPVAESVIPIYPEYAELQQNRGFIIDSLTEEEERFTKTIEHGLKKFKELVAKATGTISGEDAFLLFQSYGFPIEMTTELAGENGITVDIEGYEKKYHAHQELSRTASAGTFKSGLQDNSEQTTRLHTATHLLNEALRKVLGDEVRQKGSNITPERLRFDFNFPRKLTPEELTKIEHWVNARIAEALPVTRTELPLSSALKSGAQAEFGAKYPDVVSMYTIGPDAGFASREICTGPHVKNTKEIGTFRIVKEEASAAGVRRIKATVS